MPNTNGTKEIFVILHGEKWDTQADPHLTQKGEDQADSAEGQYLLPRDPTEIICGTGRRHLETARIFGLRPTLYSPLVGTSDSSALVDEKKVVRFADESKEVSCPLERYLIPDTRLFLRDLSHNTILVGGRPFMLGLQYHEAREGMIFKITVSDDYTAPPNEIEDIKMIFSPYDEPVPVENSH